MMILYSTPIIFRCSSARFFASNFFVPINEKNPTKMFYTVSLMPTQSIDQGAASETTLALGKQFFSFYGTYLNSHIVTKRLR